MTRLSLAAHDLHIGTGEKLVVMAGMNVLESRDLAMRICEQLKAVCERLDLPYIFKASFDKANRSSITSYRGPGLDEGLRILADVKAELGVPVITDYHTAEQAQLVADVAEIIQVPAFLVRQTDLVVAGAEAVMKTGGWLHVKKAQFLAPWDCKNIVSKIGEVTGPDNPTILCERGASFGYNNLVVDMLSIPAMKALGVPVTIDATHAVQLPGADPRTAGGSTGGRREGVPIIAKSAVAAGADGVFLEFHPDPDKALCDGPSCLPLDGAEALLADLKAIHSIVNA
ncbi:MULTISPECIES: 3-deoxy-8-phosphooctulonate synthase [Henriciella]|jgi:2-dehydro-3-deoxyphosphooctonate aldolase (KDO 8-P synthase)|uniref:3-deoxy-8-phosphooctulonate synthase n=1 Tax=Henriciella pelagia TaxID=1977912 RepID=A0ABQ1JR36_9PROT|nr:3-deoxy-8-phosphooctulonate synthase [Henriciella pelagia]GGB75446.1 2-dehydro-3-deoxyphosphooctonate aldolase [Henriciella pelagia]